MRGPSPDELGVDVSDGRRSPFRLHRALDYVAGCVAARRRRTFAISDEALKPEVMPATARSPWGTAPVFELHTWTTPRPGLSRRSPQHPLGRQCPPENDGAPHFPGRKCGAPTPCDRQPRASRLWCREVKMERELETPFREGGKRLDAELVAPGANRPAAPPLQIRFCHRPVNSIDSDAVSALRVH